jgi:ligand-binding sensor domain-containing protein/signal transduction histidine kinase/DNA-binding response OmpR family regulator
MREFIFKVILISFCLFNFHNVRAQFKELKFKNLTKESGLSCSDITSITQTPDGFLWIGTSDGLNRFDGNTFLIYRNDPHNPNSISDNNITSLFVDSKGNLWIGTKNNGLNKYEREKNRFQSYKSLTHQSSTICSNYVRAIEEDTDGHLWVGTTMGLSKYDGANDSFRRYFHEIGIVIKSSTPDSLLKKKVPKNIVAVVAKMIGHTYSNEQSFREALQLSLSDSEIDTYQSTILKYSILKIQSEDVSVLKADESGNLWMAFEKKGLAFFNPRSTILKVYTNTRENNFWGKEIKSLCFDKKFLWIGTHDGGIGRLEIATDKVSIINVTAPAYNIESIFKDRKGNIWFGDNYGLGRVLPNFQGSYHYKSTEDDKYNPPSTTVKSIFEDIEGNIWIGSSQGGISLTFSDALFDHYKHQEHVSKNISSNSVSAVVEDSKGNVWIGYYTTGIDRLNTDNSITRFDYKENSLKGVGNGTVFQIFEDQEGIIWIGTYEGGLQYFDESTQTFISYKHDEQINTSISGNDVRAIAEDMEGNLWLAIHGHGINKFNKQTHTAIHYFADYDNWQNSLGDDWVYTLRVDSKGNVWAGSVNGLSVLYKSADHFVTYNRTNSNLSHNEVKTLLEDGGGNIWVGTENGLNFFNQKTKQFTLINEREGLPNNTIQALQQDKGGYLWISTNNGLSRYSPISKTIINYTVLDGLQSNEFFVNAAHHGMSGKMYFGGNNGLNIFQPDRIKTDTSSVPLRLTGLSLFNKPVEVGSKILKNSIDQSATITFSSNENVFSLSFVGLSYRNPEKIKYAYQLDGFENEWNLVGSKSEATYTNLDPGTYTFKVKAANGDGVWNKSARELTIVILPPFWKTPFAYVLYLMAILGILYFYRRSTINKEQFKSRIKLQQVDAARTHELDSLKLKFFTNISHEFRTPLTLITGPAETLIADEKMEPAKRQSYYQLIQRNAERMLRLVNQLLDISAIDAGFMKLRIAKHDIVEYAKSIADTFQYSATNQKLQFSFESNVEKAEVFFDMDVIEKVLYNLISNAIKFTEGGGKVSVRLYITECGDVKIPTSLANDLKLRNINHCKLMKFEIEDNGVGVPSELREKVFERFYQIEGSTVGKNGTGIGLALVKQLVQRHYGSVSLEEKSEQGSKFVVWLPVFAGRFATEEIKEGIAIKKPEINENFIGDLVIVNHLKEIGTDTQLIDLPVLLIVEDNADVRYYMQLNLQDDYTIHEAKNGQEGFDKAVDVNPDLIISDVIMPVLSGFEFCSKIKNDERTSHIPLILLTARSAENYELEGLRSGADDYVTKPFSLPILRAKIKNIIEAKQKIKDKFYSDLSFEPKNITTNSLDKSFVDQLIAAIEVNLSNEDFNPDTLADQLHVSRSQLYKKVKGLSGLSVSIFVRNIRLRKAAELLSSGNASSIAEVAYQVGFSDPGYFTKCFHEMYSKSPSAFLNEQKAISNNYSNA